MEYISGEGRDQITMMPDRIDDYVDENNAVRVIGAYINSLNLIELGFAGAELNGTGRPPYDPADLLKLYMHGCLNRVRSSRRLEAETKRNLEAIWLLGKLSPDHKTIARFRHDNGAALKNVFRDFAKRCLKLDLYGKELAAIDGGKFKAANSRARNFTKQQIENKISKVTEKIAQYLEELERNDAAEAAASGEKTAAEITAIINSLKASQARYQGHAAELERSGEKQKSLADPDSRLMTPNGRAMDACYNAQTAVDAKHKPIADFAVSSQGNDKNFIAPMAAGVKEALETETIAVVADAGYESVQDTIAAMGQGADVHVAGTDFGICVPAAEGEHGAITAHHNGRCVYIAGRNIALCPMGNVLHPKYRTASREDQGAFFNYAECKTCASKCTKGPRGRCRCFVPMAKADFTKEYNGQGLAAKQIRIKPGPDIVKRRKAIVGRPFGTIKRAMDAGCFLAKGLRNVAGEFALTCLAYNLKRAINILGCNKLIENMV